MKKLLLALLISQNSYARTADLEKINGHEGLSASAEGSMRSESGYKNETSSYAAVYVEFKADQLMLFGSSEHQTNKDSIGTKNRSFEHIRVRYTFMEAFLQAESDQRISLIRSSAAGIGPYHHILNTAFYYLTVGTAYVDQRDEFQAVANTNKRAYTYLSTGVTCLGSCKLSTTIQDEQDLKDKKDYRVYSISSVRLNAAENIGMNISYRTIFYSNATFPKKDTEMLVGASMSFK
jgi:hypothetical protein